MNHESCRERLVELVYGELAGREAREVERHLEACEACRAERDGLLATRAAMGRLEAPPAPERIDRTVLAAARRAAEEREGGGFAAALRGFGAKLAAGTAVAVLLALVVVNVGRLGKRGPLEMSRQASPQEAERWAGAPPAGMGVGPPPAQVAEPRLEPPSEPMVKPMAEQRSAVPLAPAQAKKEAVRAAPKAPAPAAPARAGARPVAEGFTAGEAAARALDDRGRDEQVGEKHAREEQAREGQVRRRGQDEQLGREAQAIGSGAPAFAARPPPPPSAVEAPRQADGGPAPLAAAPSSTPGRPAASARAPAEAESGAEAKRLERGRAVKAASAPIARGAAPRTEVARDIERRRAAGELSQAVRRFEPCPGGDRRRTAWIDGGQHILKLQRERGDGSWIEEWFDASGRLREALVHGRAGGAPWMRRVVIGEGGARTSEDEGTSGLAPETPPPPLVERDPSDAFFAGPGCGR